MIYTISLEITFNILIGSPKVKKIFIVAVISPMSDMICCFNDIQIWSFLNLLKLRTPRTIKFNEIYLRLSEILVFFFSLSIFTFPIILYKALYNIHMRYKKKIHSVVRVCFIMFDFPTETAEWIFSNHLYLRLMCTREHHWKNEKFVYCLILLTSIYIDKDKKRVERK